MFSNLIRIQATLVYAIVALVVALFVVYLGFMTRYYVLFFDGTFEMFEYYKQLQVCLLYTSPSPRDGLLSRMPSSA